jgi:hypothetical protein
MVGIKELVEYDQAHGDKRVSGFWFRVQGSGFRV